MTATTPAEIDQLARRFPLVPRPRPALPPLPEQLAEIAALARTPPEHSTADARISTAHNKAALIASNCDQPDLARTLCWQHHHRYAGRRPWTAREARFALEPLVNLARLHIRARHPDTAIQILQSLLTATNQGGVADVEGHPIDLGATIATRDDRDALRRWMWTVTLADGVRALARAGRWEDALAHAERHHGIGATLLDGCQIAVLTHALRGDHGMATSLLAASRRAEPWHEAVAHVLALLIKRCGGARVSTEPNGSTNSYALDTSTCAPDAFGLEVRLAVTDLIDGPTRCVSISELVRSAAPITDATLANMILTHPARRHLPRSLLDHLTAVRNHAYRLDLPACLHNELVRALDPSFTSSLAMGAPRPCKPAS